jgi:vancomycin resistance protein YoaR
VNKTRLTSKVILITVFQLIVCISLSSFALKFYYSKVVLPGITVQGVNIGSLAYSQAVEKLKQDLPYPSQKMILQVGLVKYGEIQYTADHETTVREAIKYSQKLSSRQIIKLMFSNTKTHDFVLTKTYNNKILNGILDKAASQYYEAVQNAYISFDEKTATVFQDTYGRKLDKEASIQKFISSPYGNTYLALSFQITEPTRKTPDYDGINSRLSLFVSDFDVNETDRTRNIELASESINNVIIRPGEVFSLNKTLGKRTSEAGYRKTLENTYDVDLIASHEAGICQVAGTLYNAVCRAGLTVVEKRINPVPVPYIPENMESVIADENNDFKFANNTSKNILIASQIHQGELKICIMGHKGSTPIRQIKTEKERYVTSPPKQYVLDPTLPPGLVIIRNPGSNGYAMKIYEVILKNEREIDRILTAAIEIEPEPELLAISPMRSTIANLFRKEPLKFK